MDSKKSPKGRKRSSKGSVAAADDGTWDCSVCTFKNNAEAFKCSMCDVRKGTSTRKPRLNPDLVAAQQAQALTPPPPPFPSVSEAGSPIPSSSKTEPYEPPEEEEEPQPSPSVSPAPSASKVPKKPPAVAPAKKNDVKKTPNKARLKNVDRSSATYHSVTVDDFTVVITEFKPKVKKEKKAEKISSPNSSSDTNDKNTGETNNVAADSGTSRNGTSNSQDTTTPIKAEAPNPGDGNEKEAGSNGKVADMPAEKKEAVDVASDNDPPNPINPINNTNNHNNDVTNAKPKAEATNDTSRSS